MVRALALVALFALFALFAIASVAHADPEEPADTGNNVITPNLLLLATNTAAVEYERVVTPHLTLIGEALYFYGTPLVKPGTEVVGRSGFALGFGARWYFHGHAPTGWFANVYGEALRMHFDDDTGGTGFGVNLQVGYSARLLRWLTLSGAVGLHASLGAVSAVGVNDKAISLAPEPKLGLGFVVPSLQPLDGRPEPLRESLRAVTVEDPHARPWFVAQDVAFWAHVTTQYLHLADHYLRDHEPGWPLASKLTSMTLFGLVITPGRVAAQLGGAGSLFWVPLDAVQLGLLVLTHRGGGLDSPSGIYRTHVDGPNKLGTSSPALGRAAQVNLYTMMASLGVHLTLSAIEGARYGFKLARPKLRAREASIAVVPTPDGGLLASSWTW